jgi:hypothetical protein
MSSPGRKAAAPVEPEKIAPNTESPKTVIGSVAVVQVVALKRVKEGYTLLHATVPESIIAGYISKKDGPHNLGMIAAKLNEWTEKIGFGAG